MNTGDISQFDSSFKPGANLQDYWQHYQCKIDKYDNTAPPPTFINEWATKTLKWGARVSLGKLGDNWFTVNPQNPLLSGVSYRLLRLAENSMSYHELLGIGYQAIEKDTGVAWPQFLQSRDNWQLYRQAVKHNFGATAASAGLPNEVTASTYLKQTVIGDLADRLHDAASTGKVCTLAARSAGPGLSLWNVLSKTCQALTDPHKSTGTTLVKESLKGFACWELGNIGVTIASGLVCLPGWPRMIGGWIAGSLLSTLCGRVLSKVIPN